MSSKDETKPRFFTVNYRERDGKERGQLVNVGFFWHNLPRLIPLCRLFGHVPVVDGANSRWVCCDRCGVRPDSQGSLDPEVWSIGQRYDGPYADAPPDYSALRALKLGDRMPEQPKYVLPGPWPKRPVGALGGQLVIGGPHSLSAEVKVGNAGSEHTLAAHASIHRVGWLSLHTERFGTWLQRRLIPTEYESRKIGFSAHDGRVHWSLWEPRDSWSHDQPKWWGGSFRCDLRDIVLGELQYSRENVGVPIRAVVRMPYGDDDVHDVVLQLQQVRRGRKRGRPKEQGWSVDWECQKGIPVRDHAWKGHGIHGSGVTVTQQDVESRLWPQVAVAKIAANMMRDRVRHGFTPALFEDVVDPAMEL